MEEFERRRGIAILGGLGSTLGSREPAFRSSWRVFPALRRAGPARVRRDAGRGSDRPRIFTAAGAGASAAGRRYARGAERRTGAAGSRAGRLRPRRPPRDPLDRRRLRRLSGECVRRGGRAYVGKGARVHAVGPGSGVGSDGLVWARCRTNEGSDRGASPRCAREDRCARRRRGARRVWLRRRGADGFQPVARSADRRLAGPRPARAVVARKHGTAPRPDGGMSAARRHPPTPTPRSATAHKPPIAHRRAAVTDDEHSRLGAAGRG